MKKSLVLIALLFPTFSRSSQENLMKYIPEVVGVAGTVLMAYADNKREEQEKKQQENREIAQQKAIHILTQQEAPLTVLKELGLAETDERLFPSPLKRAKMVDDGEKDLLDAQDVIVKNLEEKRAAQLRALKEKLEAQRALTKAQKLTRPEDEEKENEEEDGEQNQVLEEKQSPLLKEHSLQLKEEIDRRKEALIETYNRIIEQRNSTINHFKTNPTEDQDCQKKLEKLQEISHFGFSLTVATRAVSGCPVENSHLVGIKIALLNLLVGGCTGASTRATLWGMVKSFVAESAGVGLHHIFLPPSTKPKR